MKSRAEIKNIFADRMKKFSDWKKQIEKSGNPYKAATEYSKNVGKAISKILEEEFAMEELTEAEITALVKPLMLDGYSYSVDLAAAAQTTLNKRAGISIRVIEPDTKTVDRIDNLAEKLIGEGEKGNWLLGKDVAENVCRAGVTDTIEENAKFQKSAGLHSYIERTTGGGCCEWCESMAGRYEYGDQPLDFFRVHKDCTCVITFKPAKSSWQRISYKTDSEGKTRKVTENL